MAASLNHSLFLQLRNEVQSRYSLTPTDAWLNEFVTTTRNRPVPLASLASTAHFRLLSSDFTVSLLARGPQVFPINVSDVQTKDTKLSNNIPVQVLEIQDISISKWSQIEAIERVERGEEIRGREVIRNVPGINDDDDVSANNDQASANAGRSSSRSTGQSTSIVTGSSKKGTTGPHKLLLQDAAGTKAWAFEMSRIEKITIVNLNPPLPGAREVANQPQPEGMQIGCKFLLKTGTNVRRGLIMLAPESVAVMGGRVEAWDKKWREQRKARLTQELEKEAAG
ncbi:hypothetical protein H2198_008064 [Neophaeococcomyces mojaviensis]|uniref:Uncharacterized protein n=1 Tax=Neophaeococcomyces mojaviensis TaxID=3383035 RepID=A0ACC2ZY73_9EURO|nr:hypothetical protein H2198_008064 [Knufia sp. JES_112]